MRKLLLAVTAGVLLLPILLARAQLSDFGDRAVELRGLVSEELARPDIPDDAIADPPPGAVPLAVPRPLSLVYRYYSCIPWLRVHVRSVFSSVPGWDPATTVVDTGNDNPEFQIVNEANEARLGMHPGTALSHFAYGLYCLRVVVIVPWAQWTPGTFHRFHVRLHYRHPYVSLQEQWWYCWRSPAYSFRVQLNAAQQVPPNSSIATGSGTLALDPQDQSLSYDIPFSGLGSAFSQAHIHGPAGAGTNAGVIYPIAGGVPGATSGRFEGVTPPLNATQLSQLGGGLLYVNIHSATFPSGEIRGQILQATQAVYAAWRPTWTPMARWSRVGPIWCLTLTDPYGYPWDRWHRPRTVGLYGLREYYTIIGNIRAPATLPFIGGLTANHSTNWFLHPKPPQKYWPYTANSTRSYWFRAAPFSLFRHLPPVVQFATWMNPDTSDPPVVSTFPDVPDPSSAGTVGITTLRALVSQQGDLTGDGFENLSDLSNYRQEQGTDSQDTQDTDGPP